MPLAEALKELGFPKNCQKIYRHLFECGPETAGNLSKNFNITRPSVYDALRILIKKDLVTFQKMNNKKVFQATDSKYLTDLLQTRIELLGEKEKAVKSFPQNSNKNNSFFEPNIRLYNGTEGLFQGLKDVNWHENIEIAGMWPDLNLLEHLGKESIDFLLAKYAQKNIRFRLVWKLNCMNNLLREFPQFSELPFIESRVAPPGMDWGVGFLTYADKSSYIVPPSNFLLCIVQSPQLSDLMRLLFEQVWKISKPVKRATTKRR